MTTLVSLKHVESGAITEHHSVDAAEILCSGEYEQVAGPQVRIAAPAKPKVEPGPPIAVAPKAHEQTPPPALDRAHMKHRGFGKWDVLRADGTEANEAPLTKAEAETLLATLT